MNEALGISASGESSDEAVTDLVGQVIHFFYHYRELEDTQVTGLAQRLKARFAELFIEA